MTWRMRAIWAMVAVVLFIACGGPSSADGPKPPKTKVEVVTGRTTNQGSYYREVRVNGVPCIQYGGGGLSCDFDSRRNR